MLRKNKNRRSNFTESPLFLDGAGLIFVFLAGFTGLSLLSYSHLDHSWFTAGSSNIKNLGGITGAYWSSLLIQCFGANSFLVVGIFALASVGLFRRISRGTWALAVLNYSFLLLTSSAFLAFVHESFHYRGANLLLGGVTGQIIKNYLSAYLNVTGAALATALLLVLAVSLSTNISVASLGAYVWWAISRAALWTSMGVLGMMQACKTKMSTMLLAKRAQRSIAAPTVPTTSAAPAIRRPLVVTDIEKLSLVRRIVTLLKQATVKHGQEFGDALFGSENRESVLVDAAEKVTQNLFAIKPADSLKEAGASPEIITLADQAPRETAPTTGPQEAVKKRGLIDIVAKAAKANDRLLRKVTGLPENFQLPSANLLRPVVKTANSYNRNELLNNSQMLEEKIHDFKVQGSISAVKPGPVITIYEFKPGTGVKVNSIANLADDLALALSAQSLRIEAPIPGRDVVGIEVPNTVREDVFLKEIIDSKLFKEKRFSIPIAIGKDTMGEPVVADLKKMPHMLVAGATGSGKSVFINSLICSLLYRFTPKELKLILVDPKQLELAFYDSIPHLLLPVVTDAKHASLALRWAVNEMERRYQLIARSGMRDIDGYNQKFTELGERAMAERLGLDEHERAESLPKIVIVIDELADLMMTAKSDVENNICRLAQKARAAGIHLVLATQRPSVDVITGLIKANLPARISFRLSSKNDSRTIFDTMGAERLVGNGDMLFMPPGESRLLRMHGAYISEQEIESITDHWRAQGIPEYREDILVEDEADPITAGDLDGDGDSLYADAVDIAVTSGIISASMLQRRFRIGYNRAARLVEAMEAKGIVGPAEGSKPRPVLIQR